SWKAENMRKYFERMENCHYRRFPWRWIHQLLNPTRHGYGGWLSTQVAVPVQALKQDKRLVKVIARAAEVAAKAVEMPLLRLRWCLLGRLDPNDWRLFSNNAVGIRRPLLATHQRRRNGTREFLLSVQQRFPGNLTLELNALAAKVLFDEKNRAVGVEYLKGERMYRAHYNSSDQPAEKKSVQVTPEVILAAR